MVEEEKDKRGLWMKAHQDRSLVLSPSDMPFVRDVNGKDVCVLGSGDNEVAVALAGRGGHVMFVDTSQRRLDVAADRARMLGLELSLLQSRTTDM